MKQMMKQMGIDVDEIDAEEVVIRTADEEYVFEAPQVTKMDAQGQQTFQVVGDFDTRPRGAGGDDAADAAGAGADEGADTGDEAAGAIPDADVQIVAGRAGVSEDEAREALEAEDGDLAAAISRLE
jgi:nascent polypeptide-associated complex subunit alpha